MLADTGCRKRLTPLCAKGVLMHAHMTTSDTCYTLSYAMLMCIAAVGHLMLLSPGAGGCPRLGTAGRVR